jgi:phosphate transport system substrate-binding protein
VELIYALQNKITYGDVKNASGKYVRASIAGVTEAAASVKNIPADYRVSITNAPGANAYPISSFTWLLVPLKSSDPKKAAVLRDLLSWIVKSGESQAAGLSYAPLPASVVEKELKTIYALK